MMICLLRHIFSVVKKFREMCNLLFYAFSGFNNNILISLYKVYVRSLLDSTLITSYYMYLIDLLENVQRNFNKKLPDFYNFNYIERLRVCKLEAFEMKRIRINMLFGYKLLRYLVKCNLSE